MATVIQIKRSAGNTGPTAAQLSEGEMAYAQDASNDGTSAKLYIESVDSAGAADVHAVGGKFYTDLTDANAADLAAATAAKTANELARRDANGAISADLTGDVTGNVSGTAASWATARTITLQGDVNGTISLDGSGDVTSSSLTVTGAEATSLTGDVTGDVYSEDGLVKILENGTDGSDAVFIGDVTGNADTATALETARTIGGVSFDGSANIDLAGVNTAGNQDTSGNAATATALETARTIEISGAGAGSASFDGTGNIDIDYTLNDSGVTAGQVGSTTEVPIITVDAKGLVTATSTATIATSLDIADTAGNTDTVAGGETLTFSETNNETSVTISNNEVTVGLANSPTLSGDVTISGGLTVAGTTTTVNSTDMDVADSLVRFARDNGADALDIGFVGKYNDGSNDLSAGLFRDASDGKFNLFIDTQEDLSTATTVNKLGTGYSVATMVANLEGDVIGSLSGGTVSGLSAAINVADGGTGSATHTANGVLLGNGAGALVATAAGTEGQVLMADANGLPSFQPIDGGTF